MLKERFITHEKNEKEEEQGPQEATQRTARERRKSKLAECVGEGIYETPEGQVEKWRYIYDAEKKIEAAVEFLSEYIPVGEKTARGGHKGVGRVLKKYVLYGERDGKRTETDIMKMINPHGTEMMVAAEDMSNYHYNDAENTSVSPPLYSLSALGTMFHEQGHAAQHRDKKFDDVGLLYSASKRIGVEGGETSYGTVSQLTKEIRSLAGNEVGEIMSEEEAERALQKIKLIDDQINKKNWRNQDLMFEKDAIEKKQAENLKGFISRSCNGIPLTELRDQIKDTDPGNTEEIINKMKTMGFQLSTAQIEEKQPKGERTFTLIKGKKQEEEEKAPPLSIADIKDPFIVRQILKQFGRMGRDDIKIDYRDKGEKMIVEFPAAVEGHSRTVTLELMIPVDNYLEYKMLATQSDLKIDELTGEEKENEEAMKQLRADVQKTVRESGLGEIMALPARILERNATYHAFRWARKLRDESGIDLFKIIQESGGNDDSCETAAPLKLYPARSGKEGTGIYEDLMGALETYGAEKQTRQQWQEGQHVYDLRRKKKR